MQLITQMLQCNIQSEGVVCIGKQCEEKMNSIGERENEKKIKDGTERDLN